jgi:hypothetical protein
MQFFHTRVKMVPTHVRRIICAKICIMCVGQVNVVEIKNILRELVVFY